MFKWLIGIVFAVVLIAAVVVKVGKEDTTTIEVDVPVVEIPTTVFESVVFNPATVGILDPREVGLDYPQKADVIDQGADVGYALLGVDMETLDYIPLRMDVEGYIMCKDVNKAIFKLVPRDDVADKSPGELIELIREKKGE